MIGLTKKPEEATQRSQAVPKIGFFGTPKTYQTLDGTTINAEQIDLVARVMTMGALHKSMAVSCPMAVAGAAMIEGTAINEIFGRNISSDKMEFKLGHPGGVFDVEAKVEKKGNTFELKEAAFGRTARRLMEGYVLVPDRAFSLST